MGWKTDDDGSVFIGEDNMKLFLIQVTRDRNSGNRLFISHTGERVWEMTRRLPEFRITRT